MLRVVRRASTINATGASACPPTAQAPGYGAACPGGGPAFLVELVDNDDKELETAPWWWVVTLVITLALTALSVVVRGTPFASMLAATAFALAVTNHINARRRYR